MILDPMGEAWRRGASIPDRRSIHEWAHDHVVLPSVITKPGPFDITGSRHLIAPMDALGDDYVREITVVAPVRGGKTLLADVWVPWIVVNDPGPCMWNMQKDDVAAEHAEVRAMPTLKACKPVADLLPDDRHKIRGQEILFRNGMPLYIQGPAIGNLQAKGIRYLINDEVWLWVPGRLAEAKARVGDYEEMQTSKVLNLSQAGTEGDDLDSEFRKGTMSEWLVECASCHHFMIPRWSATRADGTRWGMKWDEHLTSTGDWDVAKCCATVRFECEKCGHPHIDTPKTKADWNRTGKYLQTNLSAPRTLASFHYSGIIIRNWERLVEEWLSSRNAFKRGVIEPTIQFFQKRMAEPKSEAGLIESANAVARMEYEINSEWPDEYRRFMTVDRQEEDVFWFTIRAWSKSGESRRLIFGRAYSFAELEEIRAKNKVQPNHVGVDSGYKPKGDNGVYAACLRYGWVSLKGDEASSFWHMVKKGTRTMRVQRSYAPLVQADPESGKSGQGRKFCPLIRFSAPKMADRLSELIARSKWVEPAGLEGELEQEYRKQMSSEYKKKKFDKFSGRYQMIWVCPSGNNHAWDCAKMQILLATLSDILPDSISDQFEDEPAPQASVSATE